MKNKKAFTLVELLAVIVILAIILVIAVPQIMNVITEARKGALISSAKLIASSAETAKLSNDTLGIEKDIECADVSNYTSEDYDSCTITFDSNGKAQVTIVGKGKFKGMSVCSATKEYAEISSECATDVACFAYEDVLDDTLGVQGISITGYSLSCPKDVIIPSKIDNITVTTIGDSAFTTNGVNPNQIKNDLLYENYEVSTLDAKSYNENILPIIFYSPIGIGITSVTIPNSVTSIGKDAFRDNQLTSVTIPNSVTSIGNGAFESNQLTSVTIPNSVTSIGDSAFKSNQLISLTVGNGVTTIGVHAFSYNQLSDLTLGSGITTMGGSAFSHNQLTSVTIPNSVTSIGVYAFSYNQLTSVTIPESIASIGSMAFYKGSSDSNPHLTSIINTTGRSFDWNGIITGSSGTSSVTGTYNGVNVTTE